MAFTFPGQYAVIKQEDTTKGGTNIMDVAAREEESREHALAYAMLMFFYNAPNLPGYEAYRNCTSGSARTSALCKEKAHKHNELMAHAAFLLMKCAVSGLFASTFRPLHHAHSLVRHYLRRASC